MDVNEKYETLKQILRGFGKVVVAFSGGVDSTFLLKTAAETLGAENVLACISAGVVEPKHILERAQRIAKDFGVRLITIDADELKNPNFIANKADRCFHCKSHLCQELLSVAKENGFEHIVFGTNSDDLGDFRPGNRAMKVFGARSPLAEAGLKKEDIRTLSREMGLETADAPASPCLASRVEYGLEITERRLDQIEQAEEFLRGLGLVEFRVRHHDTIARIEALENDIPKLTREPARRQILEKFKSLGFKFVAVDLQGFRSGSLNALLSDKEKEKAIRSSDKKPFQSPDRKGGD